MITIKSNYGGEFLEQLLVKVTTGNELVSGGHIRVVPGVKKKYSIPRLLTSKMLQKRIEQPKEGDEKGKFDIDEVVLEPLDFMAFTTFNPRAFEQIWRPFQPTGNLVFRELDPAVQIQLVQELAKVVDFELGYHYINGTAGTGADEFFDGLLSRIISHPNTIKAGTASTPIAQANVIASLEAVRNKIPKAVRRSPNLKYFMSVDDADLYDDTLTKREHKGANYTERNLERYKGVRIVPLVDWPKDVIVAAVASIDLDSNFWAAVDFADDEEIVLIDKLTNAGEKYFFKLLMKADTQIVFGSEIVLLDNR